MFNWLGNIFPYSDLHSLNLDWILTKMKETAAQAAKAVADAANALAQVAEAKAAALSAQTAAQNAQTAANNAQTAANNAADSAENAVNVAQQAKSAAQTAQNTAQTAQSAAQTAQSAAQTAQNTAQTAQSAADTANTGVEALNAKFPVKRDDIATDAITASKIVGHAITFDKLISDKANIYLDTTSLSHLRFAQYGYATSAQISEGLIRTSDYFLNNLITELFQVKIDILESGKASTVFKCESSPVVRLAKSGTVAMLPFIIFNDNTNETYDGFVKISMKTVSGTGQITCKVIFKTTPPFEDNTEFVINLYPLYTQLSQTTP